MRLNRPTTLLLIVVVFTLPASASEEVTVGSFVQRLAQSKKIDSHNARLAVEALSQAGIQLPPDLELSARLTEGDVARISRALGLAVGEADDVFLVVAPDGQLEPLRERVDHGDSDPVQAAGDRPQGHRP